MTNITKYGMPLLAAATLSLGGHSAAPHATKYDVTGSGTGPIGCQTRQFHYDPSTYLIRDATIKEDVAECPTGEGFKGAPTWSSVEHEANKHSVFRYCSGPTSINVNNGTDSNGLKTVTWTGHLFFRYSAKKCSDDSGMHVTEVLTVKGNGYWAYDDTSDITHPDGQKTVPGLRH